MAVRGEPSCEWARLGTLSLPRLLRGGEPGEQTVGAGQVRRVVVARGRPAQAETWDPKSGASDKFRTMFGETQTVLPGVAFGSHFPLIAARANRLAVVRSFQTPCKDHQDNWVRAMPTGTESKLSPPSAGSVYSYLRGTNHPKTGVPSYIVLDSGNNKEFLQEHFLRSNTHGDLESFTLELDAAPAWPPKNEAVLLAPHDGEGDEACETPPCGLSFRGRFGGRSRTAKGPAVAPVFAITKATLVVGQAGTFTFGSKGSPSATFISSALPPGLTFHDNGDGTDTINGTPQVGTTGTTNVAITARNASGTATKVLALMVNQPPALVSANNVTFSTGSFNTFTVSTTGFPVVTLSKTGTLPSGVTSTNNGKGTATLTGTPTVPGTYVLTITASSAGLPKAIQLFTLTVI